MNINKLTKEEQEAKLQAKVQKSISSKKRKPKFSEWLLHDKTAFKVTFLMGAFGGVLVMVLLLGASFIFNFDIFFKLLFGALLIWQCWSGYKIVKNHKYMENSINEVVYKGKYSKSEYEQKKSLYDHTKGTSA